MGSGIEFEFKGVPEFAAALEATDAKVRVATRTALVQGAHLAQLRMQEKANTGRHKKGEPTSAVHGSGPNVVSGTLRRSIKVGPIVGAGTSFWTQIGPTAIYGRRIELEYDYPYTKPGFEAAVPELAELYRRAWRAAL